MKTGGNGELEISDDMVFQRRYWRVQRIGWALFVLAVVLAVAGVLGPGPISRAEASASGALRVEYDRFPRAQSKQIVDVRVAGSAVAAGSLRLWISRSYLEGVDLQRVVPEPQRVEALPDRTIFTFDAQGGGGDALLQFIVEPEDRGRRKLVLGLENGPTLEVTTFVYP